MARFCGQCGSFLNDTAMFCGGCGAKVPVAAANPVAAPPPFTPQPPAAPAPPPGAYVPVASAYAPVDSGFGSLPKSAPSDAETVAFAPLAFDPIPPTPAPQAPAPSPAGFAPVPGYTPAPAASIPPAASYTPPAASYTPPVSNYTPPVASYTPPVANYTPPAANYAPAPVAYMPGNAYPAKKSNTLVKVLIALVLFLFVGGALAVGGLWYGAHLIKGKVDEVRAKVLGEAAPSSGLGGLLGSSSASDDSAGGFKGDPCRFLSKAEVSQAVGLTVIRTDGNDGGCSYIAKGDPADMTAKHMSSMLGSLGADQKTQQMAQKFAGSLFSQQEANDKSLAAEAATGEIPVLVLSFTTGNAAVEMKANRGAFQHIAGSDPNATAANTATGDLAGIGDEAYVAAGSMLMVRKGNTMVRFVYTSCPCNTDNIKPLARTLANRL